MLEHERKYVNHLYINIHDGDRTVFDESRARVVMKREEDVRFFVDMVR